MVTLYTDVEPIGEPVLADVEDAVVETGPLTPDHPALAEARALCVSVHDVVDADVLDAAPELELVLSRSTGIDNVDLEACRARGVQARPLPEYATQAVAEMTVAGATMVLRNAPAGHARAREGDWDRDGLLSRRLSDVTVGVVGVGRIGSEVARRCAERGANVVGYDIAPRPTFAPPGFIWVASLADLLDHADLLTLHVPLDESTHGMIGADELAKLPEDGVVVNTSRGEVVDTGALVDALEAGTLASAYVDVLAGEPDPPRLDELAAHPNVVVTPHLAAYDERTARDRYRLAVEAISAHGSGKGRGGSPG